jgi:hypothetical protein
MRERPEGQPPLAVQVTFVGGRLAAAHLADAYERLVPTVRRRPPVDGVSQGESRDGWAASPTRWRLPWPAERRTERSLA